MPPPHTPSKCIHVFYIYHPNAFMHSSYLMSSTVRWSPSTTRIGHHTERVDSNQGTRHVPESGTSKKVGTLFTTQSRYTTVLPPSFQSACLQFFLDICTGIEHLQSKWGCSIFRIRQLLLTLAKNKVL